MSLTIEELSELEDKILTEIPDKITAALTKLNRSGGLEEFLTILGMVDLLDKQQEFYSYKEGKIVVIGGTEVKEEVLLVLQRNWELIKVDLNFVWTINRYKNTTLEKCNTHHNIELSYLDHRLIAGMGKVTVEVF